MSEGTACQTPSASGAAVPAVSGSSLAPIRNTYEAHRRAHAGASNELEPASDAALSRVRSRARSSASRRRIPSFSRFSSVMDLLLPCARPTSASSRYTAPGAASYRTRGGSAVEVADEDRARRLLRLEIECASPGCGSLHRLVVQALPCVGRAAPRERSDRGLGHPVGPPRPSGA